MSFEFETTPIGGNAAEDGLSNPTAHIEIDTSKLTDTKGLAFVQALEQQLYGTEAVVDPETPAVPAKMPTPAQLVTLWNSINATSGGDDNNDDQGDDQGDDNNDDQGNG